MLWPLGYPPAPDSVSSHSTCLNLALQKNLATHTQLTRKAKSGLARISITAGSKILRTSPNIFATSLIDQKIQEWDGLTSRFLFEAVPLETSRIILTRGGNISLRKKSILAQIRLNSRRRAQVRVVARRRAVLCKSFDPVACGVMELPQRCLTPFSHVPTVN